MNNEKQHKMEIANTILEQLGGNKFIAMTGSHTFIADKKALIMTLTRNKARAKQLRIELNDKDLYDMTFYNVNQDFDHEIVTRHEDAPAEIIQNLFTATTGLYTSL